MFFIKNTYQNIYKSGLGVRRYPEADVVTFTSKLKRSDVLIDLGTGTGRNLLPLIQYCSSNGIVVGSDIAESGI